ncbi:hypothetical protein Fot_19689 [Forsythia ovata]|uniref:Uncharacterized protein n=1 Tax=Forsythia ovata TaxID=205694 RepID=A0ABD1VND5_9LAMI
MNANTGKEDGNGIHALKSRNYNGKKENTAIPMVVTSNDTVGLFSLRNPSSFYCTAEIPDWTPDAPVGPIFQTEQSLGKHAISPSVDLQIENAPHSQNQHEIMHLPVKNHRIPTRLVPGPRTGGPAQTVSAPPATSTVTEITDRSRKAKGKEVVVDQPQQWAPVRSRAQHRRGVDISTSAGPATSLAGHSGGSRFGVLADPTLDIVQCSTVVSSTTLVSTISQTQQTVGPDSRHVGPTINFSHSIHMGPSLEAPLPAGPSHLSTAPSYISSLLPTPILSVSQSLDVSRPVDPAISHVGPTTDLLQTSAFAYDYSLHDRLLTIAGPTGILPLAVDHYAESRSVIDPVYGSSLHDRPAISVGPTSTLAHSEFFDPLLDHMLAAPRAEHE